MEPLKIIVIVYILHFTFYMVQLQHRCSVVGFNINLPEYIMTKKNQPPQSEFKKVDEVDEVFRCTP